MIRPRRRKENKRSIFGWKRHAASKDDAATQMMLVSNNFVMNGGNDYTMLAASRSSERSAGSLKRWRHMSSRRRTMGKKPLTVGSTEGRIVPESGYTPGIIP